MRGIEIRVIAFLLFAAMIDTAVADENPFESPPQKEPVVVLRSKKPVDIAATEAKIRKALKLPGNFRYIEVALKDVAKTMGDAYEIQIELDWRALENVGIGGDTPVTRHFHDVSLNQALSAILLDLELDYLIQGESILITTPEMIGKHHFTRLYPVHDLVDSDQNPGRAGGRNLVHIITNCIATITWREVGGPSTLEVIYSPSPCLVCDTTRPVHEAIAEFLKTLRKWKGPSRANTEKNVVRIYSLPSISLADQYALGIQSADVRAKLNSEHDQQIDARALQIAAVLRKLIGEDGERYVDTVAGRLVINHSIAGHREVERLLEVLIERPPRFYLDGCWGQLLLPVRKSS